MSVYTTDCDSSNLTENEENRQGSEKSSTAFFKQNQIGFIKLESVLNY